MTLLDRLYERANPGLPYQSGDRCYACGRKHWLIGRSTAECAFCGTTVPLAEH